MEMIRFMLVHGLGHLNSIGGNIVIVQKSTKTPFNTLQNIVPMLQM